MNPEQALLIRGFLMGTLKAESATTRKIIEAIPADRCDYRPDSIVKSALDLAWHIASAEHRFYEAVVKDVFDFSGTRPNATKTPAEVAAWYTATTAADLDLVAGLSGEHLTKIIDFRGMFQLPAVAYLQIGLNHSIHHRGQLSTYLRPMGAKVPVIYGESYDSAQDRKAAEAS